MRSFFKSMLVCKDTIYQKRDRAAADVYSEVEKFVREGKYSTYRKSSELATMRLKNYSEEAMAAQLNVNVGTVRTHTRNVSNELYQLFGFNFFDMLSNYVEHRLDVDTVMYRIKHHGDMAVTYVLPEVVAIVKDSVPDGRLYSLEDCSREVDFLRRYSRGFLMEAMKDVDVSKVHYIIDILDGKKGNPEEWKAIISSLTEEA